MRLKDADKQLGPSVVREDYEPTRYNRPIQEKKQKLNTSNSAVFFNDFVV